MHTATLPQNPLTDLSKVDSVGGKFVVFFLDGELFAVSAKAVTEVVQPPPITRLPGSPAWLGGVTNLRGEIAAVINLQKFCRKQASNFSAKTRIIVFRPPQFDSPTAFLIDRIIEIVNFSAAQVQPPASDYLIGEAVLSAQPVKLIDVDKIFTAIS